MDPATIMFYFLAVVIVLSALAVVMLPNPIYSALSLAVTMISIAFLFYILGAQFIAGVQMIVYAGAVMVLFVMVLMLFDLNREAQAFSKGKMASFLKIASTGWLCGLIAGAIYMSTDMLSEPTAKVTSESSILTTKNLAQLLFTKYIFAFELLGLLLLLIAVGAVAVSRTKGGTHAEH